MAIKLKDLPPGVRVRMLTRTDRRLPPEEISSRVQDVLQLLIEDGELTPTEARIVIEAAADLLR